MAARSPWPKIKAEYLKGGITQKELAKKYGVNLKTLQNRASNEGWKNEKGKIREKTEELLRGRVARARVNHLEKLIEANEALLDGLVKLAEQVRDDPEILKDKTGSIRNAESFAKALQTATLTQRDLHGLKNIDQKFADRKWKAEQKAKQAEAKEMSGTVWRIETDEEVPLDE